MKSLIRPEELVELTTARNSYNGTTSQIEAWKEFGQNGRTKVRQQLENTQDNLCAYCENSLENNGHIDHFNPKSSNWNLTFEWSNLVASCTHNDSCGGKKAKLFKSYWINPYSSNPEGMFKFYSDGQITGQTEDAQKIIEDFGLDCPRLESKRKAILNTLQQTINSLIEFPDAVEAYLASEKAVMFPTGYKQIIKQTIGE